MIFSKGTLLAASLSLLSVAAAVPAAAPAEYQHGDAMLVVRDAEPGRHDYYDDDELPRTLRQRKAYAFCSSYLNLKTKTFTWYGRPVKTTTVDLQTMTNTVVSVTTSPAPIETVFPTVTETTITETSLVPETITTTETPIFTATSTCTTVNFITTGAPAKRDLEARQVRVPDYLRHRDSWSISRACSRIVTRPTVTVTIRPTQTRTVKLTTTVETVQLTGVAASSTITTTIPTTLIESLTSTITPEPVTTIVEAATMTTTEIASASATMHPCDPASWTYNLATFGYSPGIGGRSRTTNSMTPQECCALCYNQSSGGCNLWGYTPSGRPDLQSTCHIFYGAVEDSSACTKSELCPNGIGRGVIVPGNGGTRMAGLGPCNMGVRVSGA